MKVLGIIPSRYASSRFPGKPLIDLKGKSMIQRVYEGAKSCQFIHDCVVATDDERILNHVKSFGGKAVMTSELHQSGTDRCGEVVELMSGYDVVVNIQGDEPLVNPKQLEQLVSLFNDSSVEIATLAKKIEQSDDLTNQNRIKVVLDKDSNGIYFSRSPIPFNQKLPIEKWHDSNDYFRHIGLYAFKNETLKSVVRLPSTKLEEMESLEQLRWVFNGYKIKVGITEIETPNIDTEEDVKAVLKFL